MAKKIPLRQCVGCREMKQKNELIRVIKTSEGEVLLDRTGRMNGRGAYICPNRTCFDLAVKSNAFNRSLKIMVSNEMYDKLSRELN